MRREGWRRSENHMAARRAVIRALHPDRGGDPEVFRVALQHIDDAFAGVRHTRTTRRAVPLGRRRNSWPARMKSVLGGRARKIWPRKRRFGHL